VALANQPSAARRRSRHPQSAWPNQAELRAFSPVVRLLSSLWSVKQIRKLGVAMDASHVDLWVIMDSEDLDAEREISALERQYRVSGLPDEHTFDLHVAPLDLVDPDLIPPFETILER
jgi:hypothetical protein